MSRWPNQSDVESFYGNPRGADGESSGEWEHDNLVLVRAPWRLVTAWDGATVRGIRVHYKCAASLQNVLNAVWNASGQDEEVIKSWGMNLLGGGYNFRSMRGSHRLSMHSWGCAVDFDPERNGFGDTTPNFSNCPEVLNAFEAEGWTWGGKWRKPDGMHWQAVDI